MSIAELIKCTGGGLFLLSVLIQVAPIQVNPWSALAKMIGRALNGEVVDKIDESLAITSRYRIIRFDDEIMFRVKHSEEHFDQILEDVDRYEKYCKEHPEFPNNKAVNAIDNIKRVYRKCKETGGFLSPEDKDQERERKE